MNKFCTWSLTLAFLSVSMFLAATEARTLLATPGFRESFGGSIGWGLALLYVVGFPVAIYAYVRVK